MGGVYHKLKNTVKNCKGPKLILGSAKFREHLQLEGAQVGHD